jgi:hypothetical protein
MSFFQAIDRNNNVIELIEAKDRPSTILGAAQAYFQNFDADYSMFTVEQMHQAWLNEEAGMLEEKYAITGYVACEEAKDRLRHEISKRERLLGKLAAV